MRCTIASRTLLTRGFAGGVCIAVCALWALGVAGASVDTSVAGNCAQENCEAEIAHYRAVVRKDPENEQGRQALAEIAWHLAELIERAEAIEGYAQADEIQAQIAEQLKDVGWRTENRAGKGVVGAQLAAGVFARRGVLEGPDRAKACDFYERAAEAPNAYALYRSALCVGEESPETAADLVLQSAQLGHAAAQHLLAQRALDSTPPRPSAAVAWLERAAAQGRPSAQALLALLYARGEGVRQDEQTALRLYRKAAAAGDLTAINNLGEMYERGAAGPGPAPTRATDWYRQAAERGFAPAQFNLGRLYAEGNGVGQDVCLARRWFDAAAEQGLLEAAQMLEWLADNGFDCESGGQ